MKISDEETELLTDDKEVEKAAEELYKQGVKVVVVTLGGNGAYIYGREGGVMVPGFPVSHVADTNGAGGLSGEDFSIRSMHQGRDRRS